MRLPQSFIAVLTCASAAVAQDAPGNVLLVIADDLGVDRVGAYGEHPSPGRTPTLDRLARGGVLFRHCWSNPMCSPTRATILTGRYSFRTGIGWRVPGEEASFGLGLEEWTLPEVLFLGAGEHYESICVGKWHLRGLFQNKTHPNESGFDHYAGSMFNFGESFGDYFHWRKTADGTQSFLDDYATTDSVDDALRAIDSFGDAPWLVWLAFNAPHLPYHAPPDELHDFDLSGEPDDTPVEHHKAMVQAMDTELGRLLDGIDPVVRARTTIIFVGDNGTQKSATESPFVPSHAKSTLYEGGVNVPLIISGHGVPAAGAECRAMVNTTDLFATMLELCGVDPAGVIPSDVELDSQSLVPYFGQPDLPSQRDVVYAEVFAPNHEGPYDFQRRAIRDQRYKLIRDVLAGTDELYDLSKDPFEAKNLLLAPLPPDERLRYLALVRRLEALVE